MVSSFWLLQQMPSAGSKPRRTGNTEKKSFSSFLLPTSFKCLFTLAKSRTRPAAGITPLQHQHCPDAPAHKHQWPRGFPGLSATPLLVFLTTTDPSCHYQPTPLAQTQATQAGLLSSQAGSLSCWKGREKVQENWTQGEQHIKEKSKDTCNLNNLNSQQFQSL